MSDIKIVMPLKDEETYVNYLRDKIQETLHNRRACIVIFETDEGTCVSPSGQVTNLMTSLAVGALNTIYMINQRTKIPNQVLLDAFIHVLTHDCDS